MRSWGVKGRAEAAEKADDKVCSRAGWDHGAMGGAMERHGAGRAEGAERAERAEGAGRAERAGMHWDPLKSAERVQSREANRQGVCGGGSRGGGEEGHGAMGKEGQRQRRRRMIRSEAVGPWSHGAPWSGKGGGGGKGGKSGGGGEGGEGGHALGPFKVS